MMNHKRVGLIALTALSLVIFGGAGTRWDGRSTSTATFVPSEPAATDGLVFESFQEQAASDLSVGSHADAAHKHVPADGVLARKLAPSKPMSALHFVKPKRYLMHSGETVRVSLTLVASQEAERVMVTARASAGTEVVSKPQFFLGSMEPWQEVTVWFDVTVLAEGRHYVSVVAQAETPAGPRFSSYSVPVEALLGAPKKATPVIPAVYDAQGNRLKLMPAMEPAPDSRLR